MVGGNPTKYLNITIRSSAVEWGTRNPRDDGFNSHPVITKGAYSNNTYTMSYDKAP